MRFPVCPRLPMLLDRPGLILWATHSKRLSQEGDRIIQWPARTEPPSNGETLLERIDQGKMLLC